MLLHKYLFISPASNALGMSSRSVIVPAFLDLDLGAHMGVMSSWYAYLRKHHQVSFDRQSSLHLVVYVILLPATMTNFSCISRVS